GLSRARSRRADADGGDADEGAGRG
ncbi:exodeoxyribonuclease VII small subunit, partial [Kocuria rosea]